MIIILTGTPGTGKDTIASGLVKKGFKWISANELIKKKGLWTSKERGPKGARIVKMRELEKELKGIIKEARKNPDKNMVLDGHLLCEFRLKADACIILRTSPDVLRRRLVKRGYPKAKIEENVESELIDYCTQLSEKNMECLVYELDTTESSPSKTLKEISSIISGKGSRFRAGWVDWSKFI